MHQRIVLMFATLRTVVMCANCTVAAENDTAISPKRAKTTVEILDYFSARHPRNASPEGPPIQSAEFNRLGRRVFVLWYCPTSGEEFCQIHTYQLEEKKGQWELLRENLFEG